MTDALQFPPAKIKGEARPIREIIRPIVERIFANDPFDTIHKHGKNNSPKE